jgi:putative glycosyltransferase (TIGR04372 family)
MGVNSEEVKFVCIFARDDAYLKYIVPHNNWDYHNTRNSDIDSLIETTKYLIEKGFVVIRIGSIVKKSINFFHKRMIDYPYSGYQSDFMDIFLLARCKFVIGAGFAGLIHVADVFDTPILFVNTAEFGFAPFAKNSLYIPKKYKYSSTDKYLHFKDAQKLGRFWTNPAAFGLETEESSPEDILEATQEMLSRLEGNFQYTPGLEKLIQAYHKLWGESGVIGSPVKTPLGIAWLKKNRTLYF